jgi:hypothetical protein
LSCRRRRAVRIREDMWLELEPEPPFCSTLVRNFENETFDQTACTSSP